MFVLYFWIMSEGGGASTQHTDKLTNRQTDKQTDTSISWLGLTFGPGRVKSIGATISIGQQIQCLPYAGFLLFVMKDTCKWAHKICFFVCLTILNVHTKTTIHRLNILRKPSPDYIYKDEHTQTLYTKTTIPRLYMIWGTSPDYVYKRWPSP